MDFLVTVRPKTRARGYIKTDNIDGGEMAQALKVGDKAPNFKLMDKDGKEWDLKSQKGKYVVVYFYPKDNTPGCTIEAKEFSSLLKDFTELGATVFGISGGNERTKTKFCEKYDLSVTLLSDTDFEVSKSYGVYGQKKFMGRLFNGIHRSTFIIDADGEVAAVFNSVSAKGHAKEMLEAIKNSQSK